jgi:nucleoside-diphosphate-sugar epimerase
MLGEAMTSPILVTGGTGTLGRLVVRRLHDAGYDLRVLSRHSDAAKDDIEFMTGDLTTGEGIAPRHPMFRVLHLRSFRSRLVTRAAACPQPTSFLDIPHTCIYTYALRMCKHFSVTSGAF